MAPRAGILALAIAVVAMPCRAASDADEATLEGIVVTGSRIARRDFTSASPIVSVPGEAFARTTAVSVERTLAQLPQFVPAVTATSNSPSNDGQANLSLRGIGIAQTLVLIDGRRLMPADGRGSVDVNLLPPALIESVEVVTGGASAAYGSDAIAGVVNFRLRDRFEGIEFDGGWAQTDRGDGTEYSAGLLAGTGFGDGRGNLTVYLGHAEREQVNQGDRRYTKYPFRYYPDETGGFGPGGAFLGGGSGITEEGVNVIFSNPAVFSSVFAGYGYPPGSVLYQAGIGVNPDRTLFTIGNEQTAGSVVNFRGDIDPVMYNDRIHTYNYAPPTALSLPLERTSLLVRGHFGFSPRAEAYGQALYSDYAVTRQLAPTESGILLVPPTNPYIPTDLRTLAASRVNPQVPFRLLRRVSEVGPRVAHNGRELVQVTLGLRGDASEHWRYDVYAQWGRNDRTERQSGNVRISRFEELLFAPDGGAAACGGLDVFGKGRISSECAALLVTSASNEARVEQFLAEASINGPLARLPAGSMQAALGVFHKRDRFAYLPDPVLEVFLPAVPGVIGPRPDVSGFGAGAARSGEEANTDLYLEFLVPLLRDAATGRAVELDVGFRHAQYEQAGGADSFKAELTFRQNRAVLWRGSFQRAVRAPGVEELFYPEIAGQFLIEPPDPCSVTSAQRTGPDRARVEALCLAQGLPEALLPTYNYILRRVDGVSGGNPELEPEEADTATAGLVLDSTLEHPLLRDLRLSVDAYRIDFRKGIGRWDTESALARCFDPAFNAGYDPANAYCTFFSRVTATGEPFAREIERNIGGVDTAGVDVQLNWGVDAGPGRLRATGFFSYVHRWRATEPDGRNVDYAGTIGSRGLGGALPRSRSLLELRYDRPVLGLFARWQHIDAMRDASYRDFRVPPYDYFDAGVTASLDSGALAGLAATLGIENLLDEEPPLFPSYPQANTDPAQYDVLGRRYFVNLRYRF